MDKDAKLVVPGHRLRCEWNGEFGPECRTFAKCDCGAWSLECLTREDARREYRMHQEQALLSDRGAATKHAPNLHSLWWPRRVESMGGGFPDYESSELQDISW